MTNLYPGLLFSSSGLNKKSTRVSQEAKPSERKLGRLSFNNDHPRPKNSPVSSVYDVCNTSTRLIILNNKLSRKPKGSRLRGQTDIERNIVKPEPERHTAQNPVHTNYQYHQNCHMSIPKKSAPALISRITPVPLWVHRLYNGSGVNLNHHKSCQTDIEHDDTERNTTHQRPRIRAYFRESTTLTSTLSGSTLSQGEKSYLSSIIKAYSVDDIRQRKQLQHSQLLWNLISKGGYQFQDLVKYTRYLSKPHKTKYRSRSSVKQTRSVSAPGSRKDEWSHTDGSRLRPQTAQTKRRSTTTSSRDLDNNTSPYSKEIQNAKEIVSHQQGYRVPTQKDKEKLSELSGRPPNGESLLSLMLELSIASSVSSSTNERKMGRHPDEMEQKIFSGGQNKETDGKNAQSDGLGEKALLDGEDRPKEAGKDVDDRSEKNDKKASQSIRQGQTTLDYHSAQRDREVKNVHGDNRRENGHETFSDSDTENNIWTEQTTSQLQDENEEMQQEKVHKIQLLQQPMQKTQTSEQQQTEKEIPIQKQREKKTHVEQEMPSQELQQKFIIKEPKMSFQEQEKYMQGQQASPSKKPSTAHEILIQDQQEQHKFPSQITSENVTTESTKISQDGSGGRNFEPVGMFEQSEQNNSQQREWKTIST